MVRVSKRRWPPPDSRCDTSTSESSVRSPDGASGRSWHRHASTYIPTLPRGRQATSNGVLSGRQSGWTTAARSIRQQGAEARDASCASLDRLSQLCSAPILTFAFGRRPALLSYDLNRSQIEREPDSLFHVVIDPKPVRY